VRVLLTTIGSSGDVNPFLALGRALVSRGHEVTFLVNPYFEPAAREAGMAFEPLGERLVPHELARDMPAAFGRFLGPWVLIRQLLVPWAMEMYVRTKRVARAVRPDVIVGHQISLGVPWAAADVRTPMVTCVLAPATMLSAHSPSVYQTGRDPTNAPLWYRRFYSAVTRRVMSFIMDGALNGVRAQAGLPPSRDTFFGEMLHQRAVLGLWSPDLRSIQPDDPPSTHVCGFPWHDRSAMHGEQGQRLEPELERFLDEGPPPVVFTLGSVLSHGGSREFDAAAGACRRLGCRGVLVTGSGESVPRDLPRGVIAVDYAPYSLLMPRGCLTVHHGGVGTTAQSMRAGRPIIIMPHVHDQFDNAARVQRIGMGRWLPRRQATAAGLARTISDVLGNADVVARAGEIGARVAAEDGARVAAEHLERIAAKGAD
jgi:rhamnosyltransferase subunit B